MKRYRRRLFKILAVISLLLCVVTTLYWRNSYGRISQITRVGSTNDLELDIANGKGMVNWQTHAGTQADKTLQGWKREDYFTSVQTNLLSTTEYAYPKPCTYSRFEFRTIGIAACYACDQQAGWVSRTLVFPGWLLPALFGICFLWCGLIAQRAKRREALIGIRCVRCGYDLRATPERCPECGTVPADAK